jgi:hypothetical protein
VNDLQLNTLAVCWRSALDRAAAGLAQVGRSRQALHFSSAELHARVLELERERGTTEIDLERLARATNTHLHRHMQGPPTPGGRDRLSHELL